MKTNLDRKTQNQETEKPKLQPWAKGFLNRKGMKIHHPYTETGFKFNSQKI